MAALAYTAAIQEKIGSLLGLGTTTSPGYAGTTAANKKLIDNTWTSGAVGGQAGDALRFIQQVGQYFALDTPANVPDTWDNWLVARTVMMAGRQIHPDRVADFEKANDEAELAAIDGYDPDGLSYDPGASNPVPTTLTLLNIRKFVMSHCIRRRQWETLEGGVRKLRPRLWPQASIVDHHAERVLQNLWNRADWPFRRRAVTMTITPYSCSDATYTSASKTFTSTSFTAAASAGDLLIVQDGTGVTVGEYVVGTGSAVSNVVVTSAAASGNLSTGDIEATLVTVRFSLIASESFDGFASREMYYTDIDGRGVGLKWAEDGTAMSRMRAWVAGGGVTGRPAWLRYEVNSDVPTFFFDTIPDQAFTVKAEVYVKGPTITSLSATTTALTRFPIKFDHVIKTAVLAEVLRHYGDPGGKELWNDTETEITNLLPRYVDVGSVDDNPVMQDVNMDFNRQRPTRWFGGYGGAFGGGL